MKMLWYADTLFFSTYGKAMTGLVYRHDKMGALPIGHNRLINLENINMQEEEGYDGTIYHFFANKDLDTTYFKKLPGSNWEEVYVECLYILLFFGGMWYG